MQRNELVCQVQPSEALYLKFTVKSPGLVSRFEESRLDLVYGTRYRGVKIPDAYDTLIADVFSGRQASFVHARELSEAWRVLTPALQQLESGDRVPLRYPFGARNGPPEADALQRRVGYR